MISLTCDVHDIFNEFITLLDGTSSVGFMR